jgi:hypothetical protein
MFLHPKQEEYTSQKKEKKRVKINKITRDLEWNILNSLQVKIFALSH